MHLIEPKDLKVPRIYFTEFDRVTYSQVAWTDDDIKQIKLNLERKVKLLGCIKGMVIIAASHLFESELAYEFIQENPIVLESGMLVPALRSQYKDFSSFLSYKRESSEEREFYLGEEKDEVNQLLSHHVDMVVKWDAKATSDWFQQRLIQDLEDDRSVLRFNLTDVPGNLIRDTAFRLRELEYPSRGEIYRIAKFTGNKILWGRLSEYADFVYYLSGARAVNSEGVLPQENLIDFSITDLANGKTRLSEYEIFYRIFLSIIKEKTQKIFPLEVLDALTFEDIVELRKTLLHSGFVEKYNRLMEKTKQRIEITDSEQLVLSLDELTRFEEELQLIFTNTILDEIYRMKKKEWQKPGTKVLTSVGSLLTFYGTVETVIQLAVNVLSLLGFKKQLQNTAKRIDHKIRVLQKLVDRGSIERKPLLLKFLSEMSKKYSSKLIDF